MSHLSSGKHWTQSQDIQILALTFSALDNLTPLGYLIWKVHQRSL